MKIKSKVNEELRQKLIKQLYIYRDFIINDLELNFINEQRNEAIEWHTIHQKYMGGIDYPFSIENILTIDQLKSLQNDLAHYYLKWKEIYETARKINR